MNFDTVPNCIAQIKTTTLYNMGCDTEVVTITKSVSGDYLVLQPTTSVTLYPGDSLVVRIQLLSTQTGRTLDNVTILVVPKNSPSLTLKVVLDGFVVKRSLLLSFFPNFIDFDSVSVCDTSVKELSMMLANHSICDSLYIDSLWVEGETLFTMLSNSTLIISPSDSERVDLLFRIGGKGIHNANIHIRYSDGLNIRDSIIPMEAFVYSGKGILATNTSALDFGTTTFCDEKDSTIILRNRGCDTLVISDAKVLGSGFDLLGLTIPIILGPGEETVVRIHTILDTVGGKMNSMGSLTFTSNADNILSPVSLSHSYSISKNRDVGFYLDPVTHSGGDQSFVAYDIKESVGKSFTGAGVQRVNFDLNYNTDLLEFNQSKSSTNISSSNGRNFVISGSPEIQADTGRVIATVGFLVYLTRDSVTMIEMTKRTDTMILPCNIMTLGMGGTATFDYKYLCSERSISGFMSGVMPMRIVSIRPNPAQDKVTIDVHAAIAQDVSIRLINALGTIVYSGNSGLVQGPNNLHLGTNSLSQGMYQVQIRSTAGAVERSFVKVR